MAPAYPSLVPADALSRIAAGLQKEDQVCCPDFLSEGRVLALRRECQALHRAGRFHAAGVGRESVLEPMVRGDEILWLEEEESQAPEGVRLLQDEFSRLREAINAETFLGLQDFEGHYALYPAGTRYARHVDRFKSDDRRVISVVLYLNEAWGLGDGGELCLYRSLADSRPVAQIVPQGGTLVCFLSENMPHEVLQARRPRLSVTGWFRRRS